MRSKAILTLAFYIILLSLLAPGCSGNNSIFSAREDYEVDGLSQLLAPE